MTACIIGWAHTPFGKHQDRDYESLMVDVAATAIKDAGMEPGDIDEIFVGLFNGGFERQEFPASLALQTSDALRFKPVTHVENACATGSAAIYQGINAIEARLQRDYGSFFHLPRARPLLEHQYGEDLNDEDPPEGHNRVVIPNKTQAPKGRLSIRETISIMCRWRMESARSPHELCRSVCSEHREGARCAPGTFHGHPERRAGRDCRQVHDATTKCYAGTLGFYPFIPGYRKKGRAPVPLSLRMPNLVLYRSTITVLQYE